MKAVVEGTNLTSGPAEVAEFIRCLFLSRGFRERLKTCDLVLQLEISDRSGEIAVLTAVLRPDEPVTVTIGEQSVEPTGTASIDADALRNIFNGYSNVYAAVASSTLVFSGDAWRLGRCIPGLELAGFPQYDMPPDDRPCVRSLRAETPLPDAPPSDDIPNGGEV